MMETVLTSGAIRRAKLQSNRHHHQTTNTQFLTGQTPFLSPNQHCHSTEGKETLQLMYINNNLSDTNSW